MSDRKPKEPLTFEGMKAWWTGRYAGRRSVEPAAIRPAAEMLAMGGGKSWESCSSDELKESPMPDPIDLDELERVLAIRTSLSRLGPSRDDGQAAECRRLTEYAAEQAPALIAEVRSLRLRLGEAADALEVWNPGAPGIDRMRAIAEGRR